VLKQQKIYKSIFVAAAILSYTNANLITEGQQVINGIIHGAIL
jgi:hypothetical protein